MTNCYFNNKVLLLSQGVGWAAQVAGRPEWPQSHSWPLSLAADWELNWGYQLEVQILIHVGLSVRLLELHQIEARFLERLLQVEKMEASDLLRPSPKITASLLPHSIG